MPNFALFKIFAVAFFICGIFSVVFGFVVEQNLSAKCNSAFFSNISLLMNHGSKISFRSSPTIRHKLLIRKCYFWHFYFVGMLWMIAANRNMQLKSFYYSNIKICLFGHLLRRFVETKYLFRYSQTSYMHLIHYIVGLLYYPLMLQLLDRNFDFCSLRQALFWCGFLGQLLCHLQLARLKKGSPEDHNCEPWTGVFSLLDCWNPHYFFEIVIWMSLTCDYFTFLNLLWVISNLSVSAWKSKLWYEQQSKAKHAALIPFVF